jgi:hypothetical protein
MSNRPVPPPAHRFHPKSKFSPEEDALLIELVNEYGLNDWDNVTLHLRGRNARQCRDRWLNYLSPDVKNGPWTGEEEKLLLEKYEVFGATWKRIAAFFPTRTDINVKSRWHLIQRRTQKQARKKFWISSDALPFYVQRPNPPPVEPAVSNLPPLFPVGDPTGPNVEPLMLAPNSIAQPAEHGKVDGWMEPGAANDLWDSMMMNTENGAEFSFDGWF